MDESSLRQAAQQQIQKANDLRQQGTVADGYRDQAQRLRVEMDDYLRRSKDLQRQIDDLEQKANYADQQANSQAEAYEREAQALNERANQAAMAEAQQRIRNNSF